MRMEVMVVILTQFAKILKPHISVRVNQDLKGTVNTVKVRHCLLVVLLINSSLHRFVKGNLTVLL